MKERQGYPMISIIVPVYNAEKTLHRCIDSVINQTFKDYELLLVDDGSKDKSGDICDEYEVRNIKVKAIHKENGGVSSARNVGLNTASGEYIMFLDSDDRFSPQACEIMVRTMKNGNYDCVACGILQDSGSIWCPKENIRYDNSREFRDRFVQYLESELLSVCFNKIYRRELISAQFRKDMGFGEDLVFCLDYLANCEKICFIKDLLYLHNNINEASITHHVNASRLMDIERAQNKIIEFYKYDTIEVYRKYVKDISFWLTAIYTDQGLTPKEKCKIISEWKSKSYIKDLHFSKISLPTRQKVILYLTIIGLCSVVMWFMSRRNLLLSSRCLFLG